MGRLIGRKMGTALVVCLVFLLSVLVVRALQDPDNFSSNIGVFFSQFGPAEGSDADHGPLARAQPDGMSMICSFSLTANDGQLYSMGYEAKWKDPSEAVLYSHTYSHLSTELQGGMEIPWPGAFGTYTCLVHWNVNPIGWLWTDSATLTFRPVCNDPAENELVSEYYDSRYGVTWKPGCFDFWNVPVDGAPYFSFSEWMVSQRGQHEGWWPWTLDAYPLGVTYIRSWYGHPLAITSGYRCPHINATIEPPGAADSRHQYGDAVDLLPTDQVWNEAERDYLEYIAKNFAGATWVESWAQTKDHLHADWR